MSKSNSLAKIKDIIFKWFLLFLALVLIILPFFKDALLRDYLNIYQMVGIIMIVIVSVIFYYDNKISQLNELCKKQASSWNIVSITEAINLATEKKNKFKHIRIFASTTGDIVIPISHKIGNLEIEKCTILIRSEKSVLDKKQSTNITSRVNEVMYQWKELKDKGKIKELEIKKYDYIPPFYVMIFDNNILIKGLFFIDENSRTLLDKTDPFVIYNDTNNSHNLITYYQRWFDNIVNYTENYNIN